MIDELVMILLALTVHEFGHFIHYLYKGYKPKFVWLWIGPGVEPHADFIPVKDVLMNITIAIAAGSAILIALQASQIIVFAYIAGCFVDMANFQNLIIYLMRKTITLNTNMNNIKVVVSKN